MNKKDMQREVSKVKALVKQREIAAYDKGFECGLRIAIADVRDCFDGLLAIYKANTE